MEGEGELQFGLVFRVKNVTRCMEAIKPGEYGKLLSGVYPRKKPMETMIYRGVREGIV